MQINKGLVFDIWADYAHFRKAEATTSPLTYSIPPGTVLAGIIASILGIKRDKYYSQFARGKVRFAIQLRQSVKKIRLNRTIIRTSESPFYNLEKENPRSRIPYQYLKKPHYRIYTWFKDEKLYSKLKRFLKTHKTFYTPYLGISELIANFEFLGEFTAKRQEVKNGEKEEIHSIVKKDNNILIDENKTYLTETIPLYMKAGRIVEEFQEVLFEKKGEPILLGGDNFYKIKYNGKEEQIIFL